jgi:hypothetical protein
MCHSPVGYGYLMLVVLGVVLGFISCISLADYSIGTYIENTGPVRESFSGSFSLHDENNTHISGIYIDSVMSNDGNLSLTKSVKMNEIGAMDQGFETQKSLKYSSNNTGGHVMADEYSQSSIDYFENRTGSICFGHPYILPPDIARAHSASFSIIHAEELVLTSMSRSSNGTLDYALQIGTSGKNGTVGLSWKHYHTFDGKTIGKNNEVTLYDRTLIAGLLETLTRLYRGGEE